MRLVGFLAFNPASTFSITSGNDLVMAHASATTLLAAAGAGVGGQRNNMTQFMHHWHGMEVFGIKEHTLVVWMI